jgi:hypothetical protein
MAKTLAIHGGDNIVFVNGSGKFTANCQWDSVRVRQWILKGSELAKTEKSDWLENVFNDRERNDDSTFN